MSIFVKPPKIFTRFSDDKINKDDVFLKNEAIECIKIKQSIKNMHWFRRNMFEKNNFIDQTYRKLLRLHMNERSDIP